MNQGINAYDLNPTANQNKTNTEINANLFSNIDFGALKPYLDDDNITDISYSNNGQVWLKSLDKGVYRVENPGINNELMEKIAFQCANIMGKTFNMASPLLDSESSELRMNFIHDSIARNGIAAVFRKTPAKIRLKKEKIIEQKYITAGIHDFLIECVKGHCNMIVCGETGSGKTELVKYLASHTAFNEKIITIEDTLELHLDRIFPERDIVAMKTNNIASYSDVLVGCMRQNPKWILLSEVRSAEAVTAVRNSISSGHNILSTIHADKASSIPYRLYSLLESNIDVEQFMTTIYRYIQIGIYVRARYDKVTGGFLREVSEVCEFYVTKDNKPETNTIYLKNIDGTEVINNPSQYLIDYLLSQGVDLREKHFDGIKIDSPFESNNSAQTNQNNKQGASSNNNQVNTNTVNSNNSSNQNLNNSLNQNNTQNNNMQNNNMQNSQINNQKNQTNQNNAQVSNQTVGVSQTNNTPNATSGVNQNLQFNNNMTSNVGNQINNQSIKPSGASDDEYL